MIVPEGVPLGGDTLRLISTRTVIQVAGVAAYLLLLTLCAGCGGAVTQTMHVTFPLVLVANVDLPGTASRFDYQEIDPTNGRLVIAHMGDNSVVIVPLSDGKTLQVVSNIPTPRGVAVASDVARIFVTSSGNLNQLVIIDNNS